MKASAALVVLAFLCACDISGCVARSQPELPQQSQPRSKVSGLSPAYPSRKFFFIGEPDHEASKHGYDYKAIVFKAAHKDAAALRQLLNLDKDCEFDGAAGEVHGSVLIEMMLLWGDYDFSSAIRSMPSEVKKDLKLQFGSNEEALRSCFPLTADVLFGYLPPGVPKP